MYCNEVISLFIHKDYTEIFLQSIQKLFLTKDLGKSPSHTSNKESKSKQVSKNVFEIKRLRDYSRFVPLVSTIVSIGDPWVSFHLLCLGTYSVYNFSLYEVHKAFMSFFTDRRGPRSITEWFFICLFLCVCKQIETPRRK